jgi:hypothetical protein
VSLFGVDALEAFCPGSLSGPPRGSGKGFQRSGRTKKNRG